MISHRDGDHSSSPTVASWIKQPTRRLRAGSSNIASLFGLAPRGVCLAAHVTTRAGALLLKSSLRFEISNLKLARPGRTVSPITCVSDLRSQNLTAPAGLFSVALVVVQLLQIFDSKSGIWNLESA